MVLASFRLLLYLIYYNAKFCHANSFCEILTEMCVILNEKKKMDENTIEYFPYKRFCYELYFQSTKEPLHYFSCLEKA